MQELFPLPVLYLAQALDALVLNMLESERLMRPLHPYLGSSREVALLNEHFDKLRLIELGRDDDVLPLLNIGADPDDELCVAFKLFCVHISKYFLL